MNLFSNISRSFVLFFLTVLISCSDKEEEIPVSTKNVNPDRIYFDYKIGAEEGNDYVTIMLQYLYGGENGPNLKLVDPCKVEIDGEVIKGDSSKITGAFYELIRPIDKFIGSHDIIFTDINKKKYKESFDFQAMILKPVPAVIKRQNLVLELGGLNTDEHVRVLLMDTSINDGINRVDTVRSGLVIVTKKDLSSLVNGPLHLELIKEEEIPVKNGTKKGGKLSVSYTMRRDVILED